MNAYLDGFGTGDNLNFRVKAYASVDALPETARENTIAVLTTEKITGWQFSAAEPEGVAGMVWFPSGADGVLTIEALKRNGVTLYPKDCKQYVVDKWVDTPAKVYQGGWKELTGYKYLYKEGDTCDAVGGKWVASAKAPNSSYNTDQYLQAPTVTQNEKTMTIYMNASSNKGGIVRKENKIDITGFSRLVCDGTFAKATGIAMHLWSDIGTYQNTNSVADKVVSDMGEQWYIDLTGLEDGEYYVGFSFWGTNSTQKLDFGWIRLE